MARKKKTVRDLHLKKEKMFVDDATHSNKLYNNRNNEMKISVYPIA